MRAALGFLTVVGGSRAPTSRALGWFPVVGLLVGAAVGASWWLAAQIWPPPVAAAIAVTVDLALTGALHFDGLVDAADGLLAPAVDRERRLQIMASPGVGAFGLAAGGATLLLRFGALTTLGPTVALPAALWCVSRSAMVVAVAKLTPAKAGGLATAFGGSGGARPATAVPWAVGGVVAGAALGVVARGGTGALAVAVVLVGTAAVWSLAHRRVGGYTGDVLGAAAVVGETLGLLVGAAG